MSLVMQECKAQSALRGVCMHSSSHVHGTGTIFRRLFHRYCRFSIPELSELKFIFSLLVFVGTGLIAVSFTEPYQTDTIVPGQVTPTAPHGLRTKQTLRYVDFQAINCIQHWCASVHSFLQENKDRSTNLQRQNPL